jgi:hypothetical protein
VLVNSRPSYMVLGTDCDTTQLDFA